MLLKLLFAFREMNGRTVFTTQTQCIIVYGAEEKRCAGDRAQLMTIDLWPHTLSLSHSISLSHSYYFSDTQQ